MYVYKLRILYYLEYVAIRYNCIYFVIILLLVAYTIIKLEEYLEKHYSVDFCLHPNIEILHFWHTCIYATSLNNNYIFSTLKL